jgi:hypothetical protein
MSHKTKQSALEAARKALGPNAMEGVDFNLRNTGAGWEHESIPAANPAAVKAKAKKTSKTWAGDSAAAVNAGVEAAKVVAPKTAKAAPKPKADKAKAVAPKPKPPEGKTKHAMLLEMLTRPGGATSKELEAAAGWVSHSVRGFIGTLKQKGTPVISKKIPGEPTYYSIRKGPAPKVEAPTAEVVGDVV